MGKQKGPIVLLTDFGAKDPYVGIMKGVILGTAPEAAIVDLCHELPAQDVRAAAFQLRVSVPYFPEGSLFAAVVDPGVGSKRNIIWARTARHQFLAPDNGILSWIEEPMLERRALANKKLKLPGASATFHGRDMLAPVAARLWNGLAPEELGPSLHEFGEIPFPKTKKNRKRTIGEVLTVDHFGNAITNVSRQELKAAPRVFFRRREIPIATHYAAVRERQALALFGSSGFLELAVRNGSFAKKFKAKAGDKVELGS